MLSVVEVWFYRPKFRDPEILARELLLLLRKTLARRCLQSSNRLLQTALNRQIRGLRLKMRILHPDMSHSNNFAAPLNSPDAAVCSSNAYQPLIAAAVIAAAFVGMLLWTWGGWPDPTVDFGTQLYVPWRITQGDALYRDLAYFKGPLSPYLNASLFAIAGTSLRALVFLNLAILVTTLVLLWTLLRKFADLVAATACLLIAILVFSFIQYRYFGNYNWVTPYAHEYTHGIALSLGAMLSLHRAAGTDRLRWSLAGGIFCGLVFLTTAEVFAACCARTAGHALAALHQQHGGGAFRHVATFAGSVVAIPLIAFVLLATRMPSRQAFLGTLGSWVWIVDSRIAALGYYRASMGLDEPGSRLTRVLIIALAEFAFFGIAYLIARSIPHLKWKLPARVLTVVGAMVAGALLGASMLKPCRGSNWRCRCQS